MAATETGRKLAELDTFFSERMDVLEYFVPEAVEHLESMAQSLLGLERDGSTDSAIATLFRAVHTLKGAAYTVGCGMIGDLAHRIEDMLGDVRDGHRTFTRTAIETVFAGMDALRLLVRSAEDPVEGRGAAYDRALALLVALPALEAEATGEPAPEVARELATRVTGLGESTVVAHRAEAARPIRPSIRVNLDRLDSLMSLVGELVIARSRLERHLVQLEQAGDLLSFTQSRMTQTVAEFESKYASRQVPAAEEAARPGDGAAVPLGDVFAELEFDRYDDFNLLARRVGEISSDLTEIQLQLNGLVRVVRDDAGSVQRLSGELRGHVTRARLVPIGRLFARFARQVREGARSAGKTVVLEVRGETVEMDTAIVQQMVGPLLHLVRNAINHGIETEEERRRLGKSSHATIHLGAAHTGGSIYLEVVDDGRGIDIEAVAEAALRAGFITPESLARLGEREVLDLIFLPGLTTAPAVTAEAGRGVGMDFHAPHTVAHRDGPGHPLPYQAATHDRHLRRAQGARGLRGAGGAGVRGAVDGPGEPRRDPLGGRRRDGRGRGPGRGSRLAGPPAGPRQPSAGRPRVDRGVAHRTEAAGGGGGRAARQGRDRREGARPLPAGVRAVLGRALRRADLQERRLIFEQHPARHVERRLRRLEFHHLASADEPERADARACRRRRRDAHHPDRLFLRASVRTGNTRDADADVDPGARTTGHGGVFGRRQPRLDDRWHSQQPRRETHLSAQRPR